VSRRAGVRLSQRVHEVDETGQVVAVMVGDEHGVDIAGENAGLDQAQHSRASGVELQHELAMAVHHPRTRPAGLRMGHASAGEHNRRRHDGRPLRMTNRRIASLTGRA
jgi:hypothetical protein